MKTGYVYDSIYLGHDTTSRHPEAAQRLEAILSRMDVSGLKKRLIHIPPRPATIKELAQVHRESYITDIREAAEKGRRRLDADTVISEESYKAAIYAAGGVIAAVEAVMEGRVDNAFALVRPPGHHATRQHAMGFCLFNNVAVAARYALDRCNLERILIVDFDVHHGNGTQEAFYEEPRVLYISAHQYPHYPGSGTIEEIGSGQGKGSNINIPLPAGSGDEEYRQVFEQIVIPAARRFAPGLILVSAGYDTHWADQLSMMRVSVSGFGWMVKTIRELAEELCGGKLTLTLEGGYSLDALAAAVEATFKMLLGETDIADMIGPSPEKNTPPDISPLVGRVKAIHGL